MSDAHILEFDCCECGRHIIQICGPVYDPPMCAACLMIPGWCHDPVLARSIDPDYEAIENT